MLPSPLWVGGLEDINPIGFGQSMGFALFAVARTLETRGRAYISPTDNTGRVGISARYLQPHPPTNTSMAEYYKNINKVIKFTQIICEKRVYGIAIRHLVIGRIKHTGRAPVV